MTTSATVVVVFALSLIPVRAIPQSPDTGYKDMVNRFFVLFDEGKYSEAVSYIYSSNPWVQTKSEDVAKVQTGLSKLPSLMGTLINHEMLTEASIAGGFVHLDYIVNFERQPVRFYFEFHRANRKWITYSFGYQDDLDAWASEKAKSGYLYSGNRR
jgi:hypothetical protein